MEDVKIPAIATYYTANHPTRGPHWIAKFVRGGEDLPVYVRGESEEAVLENARAFWLSERARTKFHRQAATQVENEGDETAVLIKRTSGKGANFAGKIWIINRSTGERKRILPTEFDQYENAGFVKGKT